MAPSAIAEAAPSTLVVNTKKQALVNGRPVSHDGREPTPLEAISHGVIMQGACENLHSAVLIFLASDAA